MMGNTVEIKNKKVKHIKELHYAYKEHGKIVNMTVEFNNEPSDKALHDFAIQLREMILTAIATKKEA